MKRIILYNLLFAVFILSSCELEEVGEWHPDTSFKHVVPDQYGFILLNSTYSYSHDSSGAITQRNFSMNLEISQFYEEVEKYWNFSVGKVEYYLDDVFIGSSISNPFKITYSNNEISTGSHSIKALLYFSGPGFDGLEAVRYRQFKIIDN